MFVLRLTEARRSPSRCTPVRTSWWAGRQMANVLFASDRSGSMVCGPSASRMGKSRERPNYSNPISAGRIHGSGRQWGTVSAEGSGGGGDIRVATLTSPPGSSYHRRLRRYRPTSEPTSGRIGRPTGNTSRMPHCAHGCVPILRDRIRSTNSQTRELTPSPGSSVAISGMEPDSRSFTVAGRDLKGRKESSMSTDSRGRPQ